MHSPDIFAELSIVLVVAAGIALLMRLLRQPLILGYILTGIIVGPLFLDIIHSQEAFEGFSEIGIALLLFIIGLGMNAEVIKRLGKVSLLTATVTLVAIGGLGAIASLLMGMPVITALIIGVALFFSSTIIILKMLSDKRQLSRLHGQIAIGVILVDDIVATIAIVIVAALSHTGGTSLGSSGLLVLKSLGLAVALFIVSKYLIPRLTRLFAHNQELLFIFAIAWGFGIASLFALIGLSHEVGALFAGVSLASLPYATEMGTRLKPLRDFFVVLFFVWLGQSFVFGDIHSVLLPAIVFSGIVLIGKPFFIMATLGMLGYTKLTSFKTAVHLSQISEFSIVLVVFAAQQQLIESTVASMITLVALITITVSSYLMKYDDKLYHKFGKSLSFFERNNVREKTHKDGLYTAILFGYHNGGHEFLKLFRDMKQHYLVVDYDPEIIEHLEIQGVRHAYGDATDTEFLEEINSGHASFVASTIIDLEVNKLLLGYLHRYTKEVVFICHARSYEDALTLYKHGAAYVIMPHFLGSEYITSHIKRYGIDKKAFTQFRQRHIVSIGKKAVETT